GGGVRDARHASEELQILERREPEIEKRAVGQEPDRAARLAERSADGSPVEGHRARVGRERGGQDARQGGLAGSVPALEENDLPGADLQRSLAKDDAAVEALLEVPRRERQIGRVSEPRSPVPRRAGPGAAA